MCWYLFPLYLATLTYRIHPGVSCGVIFNLIPSHIGFCHWQILIEIATYSYCIHFMGSSTWSLELLSVFYVPWIMVSLWWPKVLEYRIYYYYSLGMLYANTSGHHVISWFPAHETMVEPPGRGSHEVSAIIAVSKKVLLLQTGIGGLGIVPVTQVAIQGYFVKRRSLASSIGLVGNTLGKDLH